MIEINELLVLNEIIYKIHVEEELDRLRMFFLEEMMKLLKCDSATFFIIDNLNTRKLTRPLGVNCDENKLKEYIEKYPILDYASGLFNTGRSMVYRESDIISEEKRVNTEFYNEIYRKNSFHHSIHLIVAYGGYFLGVVSFFRKKEIGDFEKSDILYLELMQEHMNYRIHMELMKENSGRYSLKEVVSLFKLTPKEALVLESLMSGKDTKDISIYLGITSSTVKKHLLNIYQKTGCNSKVSLLQKIKM